MASPHETTCGSHAAHAGDIEGVAMIIIGDCLKCDEKILTMGECPNCGADADAQGNILMPMPPVDPSRN